MPLSELVTRFPEASGMLSDYLAKSMPIEVLGYYERAAHSAVQYAERLLSSRVVKTTALENSVLARKLVYEYKDHGFAIDAGEATTLFGTEIVVKNSAEYGMANEMYDVLGFVNWWVNHHFSRDFAYTGDLASGAWIRKKPS